MDVANWKERRPSYLCLSPGWGRSGTANLGGSLLSRWPLSQWSPVFCFFFSLHTVLITTTSLGKNVWAYSPNIIMIHYWVSSAKAMAPHSSTLAWKIPWMEEPGRLQSMGLLRFRHDWATSLSLFTFMHWRRKCQPTPVFLPGESPGQGSLVGCCLWGRTESDMTETTQQ